MNINLQLIFTIFIISIFFIHYNLPFVHFYAVIGLILLLLTFFILLFFKQKTFLSFIKKISLNKKNSFYLYLLYLLYIILITIIFGILGKVNLIQSILEIFYRNIFCMFVCYVTVAYVIYKYVDYYKLIKIFYGVLFLILCLGIIDFISAILHITPIEWFLKEIHNLSAVVWFQGQLTRDVHLHAMVGNIPRTQSIYVEPGFFAENIFLFLPILYHLSLSKNKIFNNKYLNFIIKKTTIPMIWINLILTFSPIWLVGCILSTLIYYSNIILKLIKKNAIVLTIIFCVLLVSISIIKISEINISKTYLNRIEIVCKNISNLNYLIQAEPSLGTRLSNVLNQIYIGVQEPIFGIGHSNKVKYMVNLIQSGTSPILPTGEMISNILYKEKPMFHSPPVADTFVRYGLIGIILYFSFIIRTIFLLSRTREKTDAIIYEFLSGINGTLISYIVLCFYDITPGELQSCLLIGISIATIQKYRYVRNK